MLFLADVVTHGGVTNANALFNKGFMDVFLEHDLLTETLTTLTLVLLQININLIAYLFG